jgi:predicted nucleic acid-binding protein
MLGSVLHNTEVRLNRPSQQGCRDREEQQQVEAILRPYVLYWPTQGDCVRAFDDFAAYHLSHGIDILDALIAETAVGLNVGSAPLAKSIREW